jgi:hypothetical protein
LSASTVSFENRLLRVLAANFKEILSKAGLLGEPLILKIGRVNWAVYWLA